MNDNDIAREGLADAVEATRDPAAMLKKTFTELRKTGYCIPTDFGMYTDDEGHTWFSKDIARKLALVLGVMYERGNLTTLKTVVTGYQEDGQ